MNIGSISGKKGLALIFSFLFFLITLSAKVFGMPAPVGQQIFQYNPIAAPKQSDDANIAMPVGVGSVADGGDFVSLLVNVDQFNDPVDLYLGAYLPAIDSQNVYLLTENGAQTVAQGLAPWKRGVLSVNEDIFGQIPISSLPPGEYTFYLLITPAGSLWAVGSGLVSCRHL
jgi:hypothetical protein